MMTPSLKNATYASFIGKPNVGTKDLKVYQSFQKFLRLF